MKIAISSTGTGLDDNIAEVFGRCPHFIFAEIENKKVKKIEVVNNANAGQTTGAGITSAKLVAQKGARAVIAKNIGPRALAVLEQFNIEIFEAEGNINSAIRNYINKKY